MVLLIISRKDTQACIRLEKDFPHSMRYHKLLRLTDLKQKKKKIKMKEIKEIEWLSYGCACGRGMNVVNTRGLLLPPPCSGAQNH